VATIIPPLTFLHFSLEEENDGGHPCPSFTSL